MANESILNRLIAEWGAGWHERLRDAMNSKTTTHHGMGQIAAKMGMDIRTLNHISKTAGIEKTHVHTLPGDVLLIRRGDTETVIANRTEAQ
jgi:hypothetical protein